MSLAIRAATLADATVLANLHGQCFDAPWDEAAFRALLDQPGAFALLAGDEAATELQGFILIQVAADQSEILSIGTVPAALRRGVARVLLAHAAAEAARRKAQEMFLEVAQDNEAALALYEALGFCRVGLRPSYYRHPGGALIDALMLRALLPLRGGNGAVSRLE